ncbi:FAD-dependent oxidoreductase [Shewanella corallii]|uniref:FAD-dependent oxidoreductase n=1 Tax=Shewanella corallii TaxID=560080 RepID=A0ABT0NAF3_9GAMM|nr:FAD-dependent oxidoreductase [Shewanella corallii]MCL2915394.1 FAD-dependent oxidoreductase [Shewanella corallii]
MTQIRRDNHNPTLIIGGGLSGLFSAWLLQQMKQPWVLVEARDRLGGRILSEPVVDQQPDGGALDMGPSWYWPDMNPRISTLVEILQLNSYRQYAEGAVLRESAAGQIPEKYPAQYSAGYSRRLEGGMANLTGALIERLPAQQIKTGSRVNQISLNDDGSYRVNMQHSASGEPLTELTADKVIVAMPPRLVAETLTFEPELSAEMLDELGSIPTWMAVHAKAVVSYPRAFWRELGLSGMAASRAGPLVEIHDASVSRADGTLAGALMGFVGYNAAARHTLGQDKLKTMIVSQLTRLFGDEAAQPDEVYLVDWTQESLTASVADKVQNPHVHVLGGLEEISDEAHPNLVFSGSEASRTFGGYLEGALEATERAVLALYPDAEDSLSDVWEFRRW